MGEETYRRLGWSPSHGVDHVPVTVGLAVRVQPVLQELLLSTMLQAKQMVHVFLSRQTHTAETVTAEPLRSDRAVLLRQGREAGRQDRRGTRHTHASLQGKAVKHKRKKSDNPKCLRVCIYGNSHTQLLAGTCNHHFEKRLFAAIRKSCSSLYPKQGSSTVIRPQNHLEGFSQNTEGWARSVPRPPAPKSF